MFGRECYGSRIPNERELRIIELVAQGLKNSEIARAIGTTEFVVKNHIRVELALATRHQCAVPTGRCTFVIRN